MSDQKKTIDNLNEVAQHLQRGETTTEEIKAADDRLGQSLGRRLARFGSLGLALAFLFGKLKWVLIALKFLKFSSLVTMFVTIWAYSMLWGWPFAVGIVLLILVHELGHGLVMRRLGIPAGAPVFIPFMGAVIAMKGRPRNAYIEALVAFGGPVLGSMAAGVCLLIGVFLDSDFWRNLAYVGFLLNLFNLLPISPLDGGRIVGAFNRGLWVVGFLIAIPVFYLTHSPIVLFILIIGVLGLLGRRREPEGYFDIPPHVKRKVAVAYFGLVGILTLGMYISHVEMP